MLNITFIGAGSAVFARQIVTDILAVNGLDEGEFRLVDIDEERLDLACRITERLVEVSGKAWTVRGSVDRISVLPGTDFIVNTVEVGGLANVDHDYEIPLRYGVDQCIGDTIGPGGIFKALRTGPVWLDAGLRAALSASMGAELYEPHEHPDARRAGGDLHADRWALS